MPTVHYTSHDGTTRTIEGNVGDSVMETAVRNGVDGIVGECGGSLSCATCHVFVDPDQFDELPERSGVEEEMLWGTSEDQQDNSRLSCQIKLTEGMDLRVTTPETQV
ncbi:2Fe-2S iron-sulfur cluster-binding protein [Luteococcus sp. OSA5]|uniref:2Fe-2S iron-sulfur cluster-binding protein n=1 Tax=Luteococcus sp. OSA5 TaxID=3401630 RepID=UPI003B43139E